MQLKGLVKFFTGALILISLYQLSLTLIVRNEEKKYEATAKRKAHEMLPGIDEKSVAFIKLSDSINQHITDSMKTEVIFKVPVLKKYTYMAAKNEELSLGLDLQGGMNVTLEVSLDDLVRSMSNNPRDPALNKAIFDANVQKANSDANFITLFGDIYMKSNPDHKLANLFTKPSETDITLSSTNEQVLAKINKEAKDAVKRTYNVLLNRIDKFGVANPNMNLDEKKGIITVELAGVRDPERVRSFLQATAKLQFFETFTNQEISGNLMKANEALANYQSGAGDSTKNDSNKTAGVISSDSTKGKPADSNSLAALAAGSNSKTGEIPGAAGGDTTKQKQAEFAKKNPLFFVLTPNVDAENHFVTGPVVGYVNRKDTGTFRKLFLLDAVKNNLPPNIHFVLGADDNKKKGDPRADFIPVYAVKMPPGGIAKIEGDHITRAYNGFDPMTGEPDVNMDMDLSGQRLWKEMTGKNVGGYIAVVLDDRVYSCPVVQGEISSTSTQISGSFTTEGAQDLANILKSGKLPAPAHIVQEQVVGPTLGAESITSGFYAIALSFLAIFILMLVYYSTSGWVACISLTLNLMFTVGILSTFHATLTLPGIAGLVLGIGMAVDAHVLIFERIKEELALGKNHQQAVIDGYKRSYAPVMDGHIAQLITAGILFYFGLGPVLGFATTQLLSISISLFCGILVSRLIKDIYMGTGRHFKYFTPVSKAVFQKAHFDFMKIRKVSYIISFIVLLAGIGSLINGFDYGVEFSGGRSYTIKFDKKYEVTKIREKLHTYFLGEYPVVKTIGSDNKVNITTSYLIKQPGQQVEGQVLAKLREGLSKEGFIPATVTDQEFATRYILSSQTVLPTISDDLVRGARLATILSLVAISIYILLRFRKWQYSLGTFVSLVFNVCATLAAFSYLRHVVPFAMEINQHFIAAVLTVIGFSMNDTIIVFDRIREYFRKSPNEDKQTVVNRAINDTLPRTVMTSLTVFIVVLILFVVGGEVTRGFAFAMLIGVVTGTFSSIFVASPVLIDTDKSGKLKHEVDRVAQVEELKKMA